MIGIGITLLVISTPLYVHIIKEKNEIGQISDPVVASIACLTGGLYLTINELIGPLISLTTDGFIVSEQALWLGFITPLALIILFSTLIGVQLRHKKYGKPAKRKKKQKPKKKDGDVSVNYEEKATQYAEKHGIVDYEVDGNVMAYKETYPIEGKTYAVWVNLDTMKEKRTSLEKTETNTALSDIPENDKPELFDYLKAEGRIRCDYTTFQKHVAVYETPHGVYIDTPMSEDEKDSVINRLLNVTASDLDGYKNAVDWFVQQDEHVHYIEPFDQYLRIRDEAYVTIATNEQAVI